MAATAMKGGGATLPFELKVSFLLPSLSAAVFLSIKFLTMGINGILPRILPSAGQENYDLRSLRDGCIVLSGNKRKNVNQLAQPDLSNEQLASHSSQLDESAEQRPPSSWKRRKIRLAIDLHGWISRACHGNGAYLMDERHLSYHGRAMLKRERDEGVNADASADDTDGFTNHGNQAAADSMQAAPGTALTQAAMQQQYIQKVIHFIMQRVTYLQNECNIDVLLVLDGHTPPIKQSAVGERRDRKKKAVQERDSNASPVKHDAALHSNEESPDEATATIEREALSRISASKRAGSGIDPILRTLLHRHLLNELRSNRLPFLIAPYEADGQLAHLSNSNYVDGVITEDSDLICLGVQRLIYKLGGWNGSDDTNRSQRGLFGTLLRRRDLGSAAGIDLLDFSDVMLVVMFVSAGCDYCDSLMGIGIVTARDVVARAFFGRSEKSEPLLKRVLHDLYNRCHREARERLLPLHDEEKEGARMAYEKAFLGAIAMYRHALVFDPASSGDVIANDVSDDAKSNVSPEFLREEQLLMEYEPYRSLVMDKEALYQVVGKPREDNLARKMVRGLVDRDEANNAENADVNAKIAFAANSQEEVNFQPPTQSTTSTNNGNQPSSQEFAVDTSTATEPSTQEFSVVDRGTQLSKSSEKTLSSLSPDLLAS